MDPAALLQRAYVLRRQGWRDESGLYQRLIQRGKVAGIRKYLIDKKRVFINNIIVTLPSDTKLVDVHDNELDVSIIENTSPGRIQLSNKSNTIGIIDGQHRVFSYHEGGQFETEIAQLRDRQNLLVTGIVFPDDIGDQERVRFEATLFLEINSTQSTAKSDLKQEIELLLRPFSAESIAKKVIHLLNERVGPLGGKFERHFYDKMKIKTTSVVSYGLRPLVKLSGNDSLFYAWENPHKANLSMESDDNLLSEYVDFCARQINTFFEAAQSLLPEHRWTSDKRQEGALLNTTFVNGLVGCFRRVIREYGLGEKADYQAGLKNIPFFEFDGYKSSQYNAMGKDLFENYTS